MCSLLVSYNKLESLIMPTLVCVHICTTCNKDVRHRWSGQQVSDACYVLFQSLSQFRPIIVTVSFSYQWKPALLVLLRFKIFCCRSRVGSFLAAGLLALNEMLQRMQFGGTELNSATLMRTLMQAHAVLISTPESFGALAGNMASQAFHPILQV